ncbi:TetR/AcrR family transcriptional regulator [Lactobacillus kalixensis]|uniref:HTH tetR-type domain-containing protein n=1 Tax=Lactobacillus kalixensis DSM 16043 TaxID=1423763 RepID=A0A0R1UDF8_9LACO|nr:TetR/AcrR family transcriptional regulator [Lactobacillus kalixensis]KRL91455.1 hypothetical protein FC46_GL000002 [Lactobacillus kalixensis DSM 16043]
MDIRINTTLQRIKYGLFESIKQRPFRELKNTDIIEKSEVSNRTFYRYFSDKNELLEKIEDDLIENIRCNLAKDREILEKNYGKNSEMMKMSSNTYRNTLDYCAEKRDEILLLLSENGDIGFWIKVRNLGKEELYKRSELIGRKAVDRPEMPLAFYLDNQVDCSVHCVINWLNNYDSISKKQISRLLSKF